MTDYEKNIIASERILQLMIDLDSSGDCKECEVSGGKTTFEVLWGIYTVLIGTDENLKNVFERF